MATPAIGAVVLVRFPFSDLTSSKFWPAVVLADAGRGDYVLCQVTSNRYADPVAIEIQDKAFKSGSLQRTSYVRPLKLFTANDTLIAREIGALIPAVHRDIVEAIEDALRKSLT